jgi:FkbM family methyltransferase
MNTAATAQLVLKRFNGLELTMPSDNRIDQDATLSVLRGDSYPLITEDASLIWDVGANVGAAALYFAQNYPNAKIECFEPSWDVVWTCLDRNTRPYDNIRLHRYGLAGVEEMREMTEWTGSTVTRSCRKQQHKYLTEVDEMEFRIPGDASDVTIMKIDTEGCEVEILEALGESRAKVPIYYIEYHSESDRRKIDALLESHVLVRSHGTYKHRGDLTYLRSDVLTKEDGMEIR